eukprot:4344177-Amphidinium_carterae.1
MGAPLPIASAVVISTPARHRSTSTQAPSTLAWLQAHPVGHVNAVAVGIGLLVLMMASRGAALGFVVICALQTSALCVPNQQHTRPKQTATDRAS